MPTANQNNIPAREDTNMFDMPQQVTASPVQEVKETNMFDNPNV